jgi:deazaflavin-dependent oxidoreductase (nitroreductase family)
VAGEPRFERKRAPTWQRALLRSTPYVYHGPFAELLRWRCVMLLTTVGRRTGKPRTTAVSFMPLADRLIVFSGWGIRSDWYRNVLANPAVQVRVGRRRFRALARLIAEPERRQELMHQMATRSGSCGPPVWTRPLVRVLFDYDAEIRTAVAQGGDLPVLELVPDER